MYTYNTSVLLLADDVSAFGLALRLASELCIPPLFQYLYGFRRYDICGTCVFSNKIVPKNFG